MSKDSARNVKWEPDVGKGLDGLKKNKDIDPEVSRKKRLVYKFWMCVVCMVNGKKLGLVGRVVLAGGVLGGGVVNSGCLATATGLAGYYAGKDAGSKQVNDVEPAIMIERWDDDDDGNGEVDKGEILGDVGDSAVNMSKMSLRVYVSNIHRTPVSYIVLDSDDNPLVRSCSPKGAIGIPKGFLSVGEYIIVAQYGNTVKTRKFEVE